PTFRLDKDKNETERDEYLRGLSEDPKVLKFIGDPRSADSRIHEDLIIGTEGSLIRSEDIDLLLSFHAYNRALHLFIEKYNIEIEKVWKTLKESERMVEKFEEAMSGIISSKELKKIGFHKDKRKNLRRTRLYVIKSIKNISSFIVIVNFIEESIEFTIDKFSQILLDQGLKANSFHIRKVLRTLKDRTKHLKIVSENFSAQSSILFSRIDIYDSEIAYDIAKKLQRIGWTFSVAFLILSIIAFIQRTI
ncbi:MAG: hypothetical protein ACXAC7_22435, partial [Candidatus Hodarchaeales archaeon]